jgi:hypothetical protein
MSIIVPKIKNKDGGFEALTYESWPIASYTLLPNGDSYIVEFSDKELKLDKDLIVANGTDFVRISYPAVDSVDFILNNELWTIFPEDGWAILEVAAIKKGILNVSVKDSSENVVIIDP